jgi:hypothetical protein
MIARSIHREAANLSAATGLPDAGSGPNVCQIPGCAFRLPLRYLMCAKHWSEVPRYLQREVALSLGEWLSGKTTLYPYLIARLSAIIYVSKLHGEDVAELETKLEKAREDLRAEQAKG